MTGITAIFSDVGGILGTNGWDRETRHRTAREFKIDWVEFEDRHELVVNAFETGLLSLDAYLERTVFYRPREFSQAQFREFMFSQSQPFPETMDLYLRLAKRYFMAALNNESAELNAHRIEKFGLRSIFTVFFSSCFLGTKKPHDAMFAAALKMSQRDPGECLFIDDRELNAERARQCGMHAIHCEDRKRLPSQMRESGLKW